MSKVCDWHSFTNSQLRYHFGVNVSILTVRPIGEVNLEDTRKNLYQAGDAVFDE